MSADGDFTWSGLRLPAFKVQQHAQEFYLLNVAVADIERLAAPDPDEEARRVRALLHPGVAGSPDACSATRSNAAPTCVMAVCASRLRN